MLGNKINEEKDRKNYRNKSRDTLFVRIWKEHRKEGETFFEFCKQFANGKDAEQFFQLGGYDK